MITGTEKSEFVQSQGELGFLTIEEWQGYVDRHANGSVFHHRNWIELLAEQYGFNIEIPALMGNGKIMAAIPLLQTRSLRGAKKLISLPFSDYLQILADNHESKMILCNRIQDRYEGMFDAIIVRADEPVTGMAHESLSVRHEVDTTKSMAEIESRFASTIRRNLNKGRRHQLEFHKRNDAAAVDAFYKMHVLTRKKLGVPVQSRGFFQKLNETLIQRGLGFIGIVSKQNAPIAGGVMLGFNGRFIYKYAASDPAALEHRPNDWLVYNAIRTAAEEGYHVFDFGISDKSQDGLRRFKSKWGAVESDVFYNYLLGEPEPDTGPSRAMTLAAEIIKRSPTFVCRTLGRVFYKYSQ